MHCKRSSLTILGTEAPKLFKYKEKSSKKERKKKERKKKKRNILKE